MNGRAFDAQVVLTPKQSRREQLLSQYVCCRVTSMTGMDIGLFDFDRHNAIYFFVLNADEQIYLRYGGRDSRSADSYLNLKSLELALEQGLTLHEQYTQGELARMDRPQPLYPRDVPLLRANTIGRNQCVECHLIADYQIIQHEQDGSLDKLSQIFRSPDIRTLGIELDVPRGLVIANSSGAAQQAGIRAGDRIRAINGRSVWTFGDFQYWYDRVPRDATQVGIAVNRNDQRLEMEVALPARWWWTDLSYRHWSSDPLPYFKSRPISMDQKRMLGLNLHGFASRVTYVDPVAKVLRRHDLHPGDIIYAVNDVEEDELADSCLLHLQLRHQAGDVVMLSVLRDGQPIRLRLKTERQRFRK